MKYNFVDILFRIPLFNATLTALLLLPKLQCDATRIFFSELSSWTALKRASRDYTKILPNTTASLQLNVMNSLSFMCYISLNIHFIQSLLKIKIFMIKIFAFYNFCLQYCFYPYNDMLKLPKTKSPQKLFPSDCITLYHKSRFIKNDLLMSMIMLVSALETGSSRLLDFRT